MAEDTPGLSASSHCQIDGSVVSEETHPRDDVLVEVVDVGQEQNRPKDKTLRHPRCHRD